MGEVRAHGSRPDSVAAMVPTVCTFRARDLWSVLCCGDDLEAVDLGFLRE
jgi:hypothetical protein